MTDWVPLDANTLALPKHRTIRGVDITLVTSPYDIPEAVRGDYNKELRRFVIEFRYMSDEPLERYKCGKDIILRIGRNSGRLYSIEIDIHDLSTQEINLRMNVAKAATNTINRLAHKAEKPQRQANYEVAKDAIEEKQNEIFESLATP